MIFGWETGARRAKVCSAVNYSLKPATRAAGPFSPPKTPVALALNMNFSPKVLREFKPETATFTTLPSKCRHDCTGEHLPGERRLRHQAQSDVSALTLQVALPLADLLVLQPLVESEGVEEQEQRDDDTDHEAGRRDVAFASRAQEVDQDDDPGHASDHRAEDEGQHPAGAWLLVLLLQCPEQDHGCVHREDCEQRCDVGHSVDGENQPDHDGGAERVFGPAEEVAALQQAGLVAREEPRTGDEEVEECAEREEHHNSDPDVDLEDGHPLGWDGRTGRASQIVGRDSEQDLGAQHGEHDGESDRLKQVRASRDDVVDPQSVHLLLRGICLLWHDRTPLCDVNATLAPRPSRRGGNLSRALRPTKAPQAR